MKQSKREKQGIPKLLEISGFGMGAMAGSVILSLAGTLFQLVPFLSVYRIMAELLRVAAGGNNMDTSLMLHWAFYGLAGLLLGYLLSYFGGISAHRFAYRVICEIRLKAAEHVGGLPMGFFGSNSVGKIKQVLETDVEQIEVFLAHQLPDFISTLVMLLAMFVIMFTQSIPLAFACLIPIVIGFVCQLAIMLKIMKSGGIKENFDALERINSSSLQYVNGMPSIKIFGQTVRSFRQFYDDILQYRNFTTKMTEAIRPGYVGFRMFVLSVATLIVPVGLLLFLRNPGDVSFVTTFLFFLIMGPGISTPTLKFRNFADSMNVIGEGVRRVDEILKEKPLTEPAHEELPQNSAVEFEKVDFSYVEDERKVLRQVSFIANPGEITALVGPSGAGKSTIAELIPRFWDVSSGRILVGGADIRELSTEKLMEQISFVFQDSFLFSDTLYNNIALGKPNVTKEQVEQAAKAARCHDFIRALPEGYQTRIGDGGTYLSGGEKQRVAIARAILKNAPILILDEASAYADAENEHEMQMALKELIRDKTVIVIAHRLTTITGADQILVISDGTIVDRGRHEELLERQGLYASMWKAGQESAAWTIHAGKEVLA